MKSGHAINVANFESIIIILVNLGAAYNPSQKLILLAALQTKLAEAQAALDAENTAESAEKVAVNERVEEFTGIGKLVTKIGLAVDLNVNDAQFSADIRTQIRKINGTRAGEKPTDDPSTPDIDESLKAKSVSQQSYDDLTATFAVIISMLKTQSDYKPNEDDVKIATLETKLAAMQSKNNAAKTATAAARTARQTRDTVLYDPNTGILKLVQLIKTYIKQAFKNTPEYDQIIKFEFTKPR